MTRKALWGLVLVLLFAGAVLAGQPARKEPFDLQIKELFSAPDEESSLIYKIPIEVKLLDLSEDANWYKVKISFKLGPLGYTYVGWTQIPVGDILVQREKEIEETANLP